MKKIPFKMMTSLAVSAAILGTTLPASYTAFAAESDNITEKMLTAHMYSMDKTEEINCLFKDTLPDVPYIGAADYLNRVYSVPVTSVRNDDGTYTISKKGYNISIDPEADTIFFDNYEQLMLYDNYKEGSMLEATYCNELSPVEYEVKSITFDLGKYGIDILDYEGNVYLPVATMNDIAAPLYNTASFINDELYFASSADILMSNIYFDRSSLYNKTERTDEMTEFKYNELCFAIDTLYGAPSNVAAASSLKENGFDKWLDTYNDDTRLAKELMLSNSMTDYFTGLNILSKDLYDGGHTAFYPECMRAFNNYPDSVLGSYMAQALSDPKTEAESKLSEAFDFIIDKDNAFFETQPFKEEAYSDIEKVKSWGDGTTYLIVQEDTAVFSFDMFLDDVVEPFKWSLDYAKENGVKNFIIDISTNTGGSTAVGSYFIAILENSIKGAEHDNLTTLKVISTVTGKAIDGPIEIDLDLDGDFDEDDLNVSYDFNFGVVSSKMSFSCANILATYADELGICVLGEKSGGGACANCLIFDAENYYFCLSASQKFVTPSGRDVEPGAVVDYQLAEYSEVDGKTVTDYSKLYDIASLGKMTEEFYVEDVSAPDSSSSQESTSDSSSTSSTTSTTSTVTNTSTATTTKTSDANPATGKTAAAFAVMSLAAAAAVIVKKKR